MSHWGSAFRGMGMLTAALCAPLAAPAAAEKADVATLVVSFDQMALRDTGRVVKWPDASKTLTLKVIAKFNDTELSVLDTVLPVLSQNANLRIVRDDAAEKPQFVFEMAKKLDVPMMGYVGLGRTSPTYGRLGAEMRSAKIEILEDLFKRDRYRIHRTMPHEIMHALGLLGHPMTFDSVLSFQNTRNSLSDWDLFFLRVLYDPKLPVGTPRVFALPLACTLIHDRLIAEANPDVTDLNRSGPHPYCEHLEATRQIAPKKPAEETQLSWAYVRGLGVTRDIPEAEKWARKALAGNDPDAQNLLNLIEKAKQVANALPKAPPPPVVLPPAEFKPAATGTTFTMTKGGSFRIVRIDGGTVYTANAKDAGYRWAGLFFGRGERVAMSDAEKTATTIWPLSVGKSIDFQHSGTRSGKVFTLTTTIKVLRTETLKIDGRDVATYVVERRSVDAAPSGDETPYEAVYTFWYAPDFGFHAKYRSQYKGETTERPVSWTLAKVSLPETNR